MTKQAPSAENRSPEILVRIYQGGHLIEQRFGQSAESVAEIVQSWDSRRLPTGDRIVVEPRPAEAIVDVLRAIADAIEQERPVAMPRPLPDIRLQLVTAGTETVPASRSELHVLWQELAHPGD